MKKITYLDMVQEVLPREEFEAFKEQYDQPVQKSLKIIRKKIPVEDFEKEAKSLTLHEGNFTSSGRKLDDLVFVEHQEKIGLGSYRLHQAGYFYVQEYSS
ncbi:hypothetical protein IJM86_04075 [bacterium]|nr:hypothetical protein [bacterium]